MKKNYLVIISIFLLVCISILYFDIKKAHAPEKAKLVLASRIIDVDLAKTNIQKSKGLSKRNNMCDNCGMLFLFDELKIHNFWMGEMMFPIDIIYIKDDEIVEIFENVEIFTNDYYTRIYPSKESNKVLELNAKWCSSNNVKIGDKIKFLYY